MKSTPNEKRELLIAAKKRGEKESAIAVWLEISVRSVSRIWKLYQETESIQPKKREGRKSSLSAEQLEAIYAIVNTQNDITLDEIIEQLELPIKKSRLSVILIKFGLSFKKRHYSQKSN